MEEDENRIAYLTRKVGRERTARLEAERLLELKSLELYSINNELITTNRQLDQIVDIRTAELNTARKEAEVAATHLKESLVRLEVVIQASSATIWDWNLHNDSFTCSTKIESRLGNRVKDITHYQDFIKAIHYDDRAYVKGILDEHIDTHLPIDTECRINCGNNTYRWIHIVGQTTHDRNNQENHIVGSFTDIHDRRESEKIIKRMAHYDVLTDVPNRSYFKQYIQDLVNHPNNNQEEFALLIIDLNDFKFVNDRYGHMIGDELLIHVADELKNHIKGHDLVSRLGGDEFALVLRKISTAKKLTNFCQNIMDACSKPINIGGKQLSTCLSIGISTYPKDGKNIEELLRFADIAMYAAKKNKVKGSSFVCYEDALDVEHTRKQSLREQVESAIANQEFILHYQPCVELGTGLSNNGEALLRWPNMPDNVTIHDVIQLTEESGLILPLSEWILDNACKFIARLEKLNIDHKIGVNLSAIQFQHQNIFSLCQRMIQNHNINPEHLQIEVTENLFLENMDQAISILQSLGDLGIQIYIDDFGTGYSNLQYLQKLPVDWVKIDKSFINNLGKRTNDLPIVRAIIEMTHSMGRKIVAEGVETEIQYALLKDSHCDVVQGFHIAMPQEEDRYIKWLTDNISINNSSPIAC